MKTLSFVIPVYNEELRLDNTFKALRELQLPRGIKLKEIIFVNDGSTDSTKSLLTKEKAKLQKNLKSTITVISYPHNRGKGYAIRQGMLKATTDYTLFFDADMSTPLTELAKFVPAMNRGIDVIVGTRKNGRSTVIKHQPKLRELLGKGFTLMTQLILGCYVTDFTCGFKAFSRRSSIDVFHRSMINGWGYDAEILFLATNLNYSLQEVPVRWSNDERTKVKLIEAIPQTFLELGTIHWIHTIKPLLKRPKMIPGVSHNK